MRYSANTSRMLRPCASSSRTRFSPVTFSSARCERRLGRLGRHHDDAVDVAEHPVARTYYAVADADGLAVTDAVEPALRVERAEAGGEDGKSMARMRRRRASGRRGRRRRPRVRGRRSRATRPTGRCRDRRWSWPPARRRAAGRRCTPSRWRRDAAARRRPDTALSVAARPKTFQVERSGRTLGGRARVAMAQAVEHVGENGAGEQLAGLFCGRQHEMSQSEPEA